MSAPGESSDHDLIAAVEREQRQLGYELHDNICQTLAGTSLLLETIGRSVAAGKPVCLESFRTLGRILETAIDQARSLSQRYTPMDLKGGGLMKALQELADSSTNCVFRCEKPVFVRKSDCALALYRIAQEAVENALQHSGAKKITISLRRLPGAVILKVKDDGQGFNPSEKEREIAGLEIMRRRAETSLGELRLQSRAKVGTTVTCKMPSV